MVYRYSWLAGFGSLAFAFVLLGRLVKDSTTGLPWQLVVLAALLLGVALTWLVTVSRNSAWLALAANVGVFVAAAVGYVDPDGSVLLLPKPSGLASLWAEVARSVDLVRNGVEPVVPLPGLVVILAGLFWLAGALLVWGLTDGHPFVGLVPPLILTVQFATIDRATTSATTLAAFVGLVAATAVAVNVDERGQGVGSMARAGGSHRRMSSRPSTASVVVVGVSILGAVAAASFLSGTVPRDGVVSWRTPSGLTGEFFGSVAYNPFVEIQKGLVSQNGIPLFTATIDGEVDPSEVYFRLLTLDTFEDGRWFANDPKIFPLDERPWEADPYVFAGPTATAVVDVEILGLTMDWLPAPYSPIEFSTDDDQLAGNVRVRRDDGSLVYDGGRTVTGDRFRVVADVPRYDLNVLATQADGTLSPLFAAAADGEEVVPPPAADLVERELPNRSRFVDLPDDLDPAIAAKAEELTALLVTPFEKGLALEKWFRSSGGFVYDVTTTPGHDSDTVAEWLFDDSPENPDYRRGYCEQFATSMALMARTLGIPSRVVLGFTPGRRIGDDQVVVLDNNAHSWVELWMPTQGWVRFDPTPRSDGVNPITYEQINQQLGFDLTAYLDQIEEPERAPVETAGAAPPIIDRSNDTERLVVLGGGDSETSGPDRTWILWLLAATGAAALVVGMIPGLKWLRRRRRMRRLRSGDITAAWEDIIARLEDLGEPPAPSLTPIEAARSFDETLVPLASIYSDAIYGNVAVDDRRRLEATTSYRRAIDRLVGRYPVGRRVLAWYRVRVRNPFRRS